MHGKASDRVVRHLKKLFEKDPKLRDTYKLTFNYNDIPRDRFLVQCHGLKRADISALLMSVASDIRSDNLRDVNATFAKYPELLRIEYVNLRDVKATFANYPGLLQKAIADGTTFVDQDTGDFVYPVLKQENTSS